MEAFYKRLLWDDADEDDDENGDDDDEAGKAAGSASRRASQWGYDDEDADGAPAATWKSWSPSSDANAAGREEDDEPTWAYPLTVTYYDHYAALEGASFSVADRRRGGSPVVEPEWTRALRRYQHRARYRRGAERPPSILRSAFVLFAA